MKHEGDAPVPTGGRSVWLPMGEIDRLIQTYQGLIPAEHLDGRQRLEMENVLTALKTIREQSLAPMVLLPIDVIGAIMVPLLDK